MPANLIETLETVQTQLSGGAALVDTLSTASEYVSEAQLNGALYAAACYLHDVSDRLSDVIVLLRKAKKE